MEFLLVNYLGKKDVFVVSNRFEISFEEGLINKQVKVGQFSYNYVAIKQVKIEKGNVWVKFCNKFNDEYLNLEFREYQRLTDNGCLNGDTAVILIFEESDLIQKVKEQMILDGRTPKEVNGLKHFSFKNFLREEPLLEFVARDVKVIKSEFGC